MSKISTETLDNRIRNVIDVHRKAQDVTFGEIIGVLEFLKMDLYNESLEEDEENEAEGI